MVNVLITGASGFIAQNVATRLHSNLEFKMWVAGLSRNTSINGYDRLYSCDLTNNNDVSSLINEVIKDAIQFDIIIHCASEMADSNNIHSLNFFENNLSITKNVMRIVENLKIPKLIHFSSIAVYPNKEGFYNEESKVQPSENADALYGLSKVNAENLFDFLLKTTCSTISHLRVAHVYGDGMRKDRTYAIMKNEMLNDNKITVWGMGERVMNFIQIDKLAELVEIFCLENWNGIFNVGDKNYTFKELVEKIAKDAGLNPEIILVDKGLKTKVLINCDKLNNYIKNRNI